MNNRTFWIKDRVKTDNIKIVYCPTGIMLSDFFTKPLQGMLFKRFRAVLMGHEHIDWLEQFREEKTSSKERVRLHGNNQKSNESKTGESGVTDVIISQCIKPKPKAPAVSWADVVRTGSFEKRLPASASLKEGVVELH